jgi:hypothetical protein
MVSLRFTCPSEQSVFCTVRLVRSLRTKDKPPRAGSECTPRIVLFGQPKISTRSQIPRLAPVLVHSLQGLEYRFYFWLSGRFSFRAQQNSLDGGVSTRVFKPIDIIKYVRTWTSRVDS